MTTKEHAERKNLVNELDKKTMNFINSGWRAIQSDGTIDEKFENFKDKWDEIRAVYLPRVCAIRHDIYFHSQDLDSA